MKTIEEMSQEEIKRLNDKKLIEWYEQEIANLKRNKLAKDIIEKEYGSSILQLMDQIEEEERQLISELFFSGEMMEMYPNIKEQRAKKPITCDFSGGIIKPGSFYASFRPLLKNINNGRTYVLKRTIKVESGYESDLPTTIQELENFFLRAENEPEDGRGIDYSHFMTTMGGCLSFQELKGRKKRWK